jgi:hypothetical protein
MTGRELLDHLGFIPEFEFEDDVFRQVAENMGLGTILDTFVLPKGKVEFPTQEETEAYGKILVIKGTPNLEDSKSVSPWLSMIFMRLIQEKIRKHIESLHNRPVDFEMARVDFLENPRRETHVFLSYRINYGTDFKRATVSGGGPWFLHPLRAHVRCLEKILEKTYSVGKMQNHG